MTETSSISNWIPIIGTLSGAVIGLLASFIIAFFNKSTDERKAKNDRDRSRIEKIYELLITLKMERGSDFGKILSWIHHAVPIANKEESGIPPIVELGMLINLYFPDLKEEQEKLISAIHKYGEASLEARHTDYRKKDLNEKQKISGILFTMQGKIEKEVNSLQAQLAKRVKA